MYGLQSFNQSQKFYCFVSVRGFIFQVIYIGSKKDRTNVSMVIFFIAPRQMSVLSRILFLWLNLQLVKLGDWYLKVGGDVDWLEVEAGTTVGNALNCLYSLVFNGMQRVIQFNGIFVIDSPISHHIMDGYRITIRVILRTRSIQIELMSWAFRITFYPFMHKFLTLYMDCLCTSSHILLHWQSHFFVFPFPHLLQAWGSMNDSSPALQALHPQHIPTYTSFRYICLWLIEGTSPGDTIWWILHSRTKRT